MHLQTHRSSKHPRSVSDGVLEDLTIAKVVMEIIYLRNSYLHAVSHTHTTRDGCRILSLESRGGTAGGPAHTVHTMTNQPSLCFQTQTSRPRLAWCVAAPADEWEYLACWGP